MIAVPTTTAILAGVLVAIGLAGSAWMLFSALRLRGETDSVERDAIRLAALLASGPAQCAMVRADGRIEATTRLAGWLGLDRVPRFLEELHTELSGLDTDDLTGLTGDIQAVQRAARPFVRAVRPQGSTHSLVIHGQRAPAELETPGAVILWIYDATEREAEIAHLREEGSQLRAAFDALTGLIEAAPMPMWFRGADLRLLMVNSAYVRAVDAADAETVVARGIELVEGEGAGGPLSQAAAAREENVVKERRLPATIGSSRRMLRVIDVPIPDIGVAGFAVDIEELEQARGGIRRFADAQRTMLDRLSAGVAQFAADRTLAFCNQPFRRMFALRSEWLFNRI